MSTCTAVLLFDLLAVTADLPLVADWHHVFRSFDGSFQWHRDADSSVSLCISRSIDGLVHALGRTADRSRHPFRLCHACTPPLSLQHPPTKAR